MSLRLFRYPDAAVPSGLGLAYAVFGDAAGVALGLSGRALLVAVGVLLSADAPVIAACRRGDA